MTKKIISWLLCLTLILGLAGCGSQNQDETQNQPQQSSQASTEQGESPAGSLTTESESADFDVANEADKNIDLSKYEEKKQTVAEPSGGKSENGGSHSSGQDGNSDENKPAGSREDSSQRVCYLTISCEEILDNMDILAPGREAFVPKNGMLLTQSKVSFEKGETVFDVLKRVTRECGIPMEFSYFPVYESMYIEGIGNLYEKECGSGSGWLYYVNGVKPNYGVSKYVLEDQDVVEFHYTCG